MALRAALHGIGEAQSCSQTTRAGRHSPLIIESKKNCGGQYNMSSCNAVHSNSNQKYQLESQTSQSATTVYCTKMRSEANK